jgi:hypothetical protein
MAVKKGKILRISLDFINRIGCGINESIGNVQQLCEIVRPGMMRQSA